MKKVAVGVCLALSTIVFAPCANADDASYLANLEQHGIYTWMNSQKLLHAGHGICDALNSGVSLQDVMAKYQAVHNQATPQGVATMVNAAHDELCPGA
ncbi:MAG: DUF732 domain-containing protein [Mycobacterium sp.]